METSNPFDQFDGPGPAQVNPFDKFDQPEQDGPLARGWNKAKQSMSVTSQLATGNAAGAAQTIKQADDYARANPGMQEGKELGAAWERGDGIVGGISEVAGEFAKDWREAPGGIKGLRATGRNLRALGEGIVEQVPNMVAPVTGMVGGALAGGAAGSAAPIVGNVAGAAVGGWVGASAGNTLVEGGGMTQAALQKAGISPQDTAAVEKYLTEHGDTILGQSATKGAIIGAVDTLTAGLGGRLLNAPARAAADRALAGMGVNMADKAAVKAATQSPEFAAKIAGDATYQASKQGAGNIARNVGVAALDPAGEFAGEFVGQGVATGEWDTKNAALEAFSSIGQSGAMFTGQKAYQALTRPAGAAEAPAAPVDAGTAALTDGQPPQPGPVLGLPAPDRGVIQVAGDGTARTPAYQAPGYVGDVTDVEPRAVNPVREQVAAAAEQGGALSGAALTAIDTGLSDAMQPAPEQAPPQISLEEADARDQAAYEQFFASHDSDPVVSRYFENDDDIPDFDAASNASEEDFLRALGATDEDIQDAIATTRQPSSPQSSAASNAGPQAYEPAGPREGAGEGAASQTGQVNAGAIQQAAPDAPVPGVGGPVGADGAGSAATAVSGASGPGGAGTGAATGSGAGATEVGSARAGGRGDSNQALSAPTNLRDALVRVRQQKQEAANAQATAPQAAPASAPVPTARPGAVEAAGVADGPGSDAGNGFKRGPQEGERYRVGVSSATGGVTLEKRLPAGTVATFYVGKDGGLIDADDVNLVGTKDREKLWTPTTPEQASQATAILDEMGRLDLTDPKRKDAKARLKALVTATAAVEAAGLTYAQRNADRVARVQKAETQDVWDSITTEENSDPERDFSGTDRLKMVINARRLALKPDSGTFPAMNPGPTDAENKARWSKEGTYSSTTTGATSEPTPPQAIQAGTQPAQAAAAPAAGPAPTNTAAPAPAGAPEVRALSNGTPTANTGAQAAPAGGTQGNAQTPDQIRRARLEREISTGKTNNGGVIASLRPSAIEKRKQELDAMGERGRILDAQGKAPRATAEQLTGAQERWQRMTTAERQAVAARTDVKPILRKNLHGAKWENLNVDVQRKLQAAMEPQAVPALATGPVRVGRDNTSLGEGGKPFKTRKAAGDAKKLQPTMRVVTVPGGYALAEKTPAQLAAEERASRRLRNPNTSARGEPIPAHAFIAAAGGLNRVAASDMGVDGNPRIGNRTLFAGQGRGLSMDQATQMLIQDGYLSEGATINDALSLIKTSLTRPQYNADGIERIAQAEADAQFEDYMAAQEEMAQEDDGFDPFGLPPELTAEDLDAEGYTTADPALQAEVNALVAQAEAAGIDTYDVLDDIVRTYANATQDQYNAAAREALAAAIARSNQDGGGPAPAAAPAAPRSEPEQGLNRPVALDQQAPAATENVAPAVSTTVDMPPTRQQESSPFARFATGRYRISIRDEGNGPYAEVVAIQRGNGVEIEMRMPGEALDHPAFSQLNARAQALFETPTAGMFDAEPPALELASQTPAEWLADSASERFSVGRSLTKAQRRQVLASLVDAYKAKGAQREFKGLDGNGNERYGYIYSPDLFEKSDITGAMIRYYVTLPDGRIAHPSELFPDVSASDVERMALEQDRKRIRLDAFDNAIKPYYSDFDSANLMAVQGQVVIEKNGRFAIIPERTGAIGQARQNGWELASPSGQVSEQSAGTRAVREQQDGLTSYTAEEATQRQEADEQAAKEEAARQRAADNAASQDENRKRIAQASVRAADRFELGQDPMDSLTGQGGLMFSRTGAKSPNAQQPTTRAWYDRFVSLLPASYRNDSHRREPFPAEDWNVQRATEVRGKVESLNKQLRGENDRKGYGPISIDGLGNLQVSALDVSVDDLDGPIKALANELGAGIAVTKVRAAVIQALQRKGFVAEISLAPVADRIMGREFVTPANAYAADAGAQGTIMTYKPRGFPAVLFSFAGARAATADKHALVTAQDRLSAGEDAETVRQETGWYKGVDGKWRFEISDADARLKDRTQWTAKIDGINAKRDAALQALWQAKEQRNDFLRARGESPSRISSETKKTPEFKALAKALKNAEAAAEKAQDAAFLARQGDSLITVGDVLSHPALFAAYPGIADVRVDINDSLPAGNAAYAYELRAIELSGKSDAQQLLSTLLHEIQHGIQHIEGFATGGNQDSRADVMQAVSQQRTLWADVYAVRRELDAGKKLDTVLEEWQEFLDAQPSAEALRIAQDPELETSVALQNMETLERQYAQLRNEGRGDTYRRLAGEVEARNTQARQGMTDEQRRATPPSQTADVADSRVIVMFNGKEMANAPMPANAAPDAATTAQPLRTPAATIRAAITKAYGKLLGQLESKGLVTLTQTQEQAIEAAAQARAAKTGQSVEQARSTLRASVKNSVADQTQTENFQRWFKDSKVVDANGRPLVVYHGTHSSFTEFKPNDALGGGMFFSPSPEEAGAFTGATGSNIMPVYLSAQKVWPKIVRSYDEVKAIRAAKSKGYDAIRVRDDQNGVVNWVVFDPTQVKSATGNNGDFDPADPDIRRSADGSIQGFFDPQTGQSFLIADNLTAEAAPGVLMHEVGIHMAADGSMKALFNRAAMMLKLQRGNPFIKAVQDRMDAAGETSGEEAAAYIAEAYENDRANAPASVQRWLADLLAAVKAWMFKKGIMGADRLTVADIAAVARANARSMARDGGATGGQGFGTAFSRAPAGDQTQTDAFKRWFAGSKVVDANGRPLVVYHGTNVGINEFKPAKGLRSAGGLFESSATSPFKFFSPDKEEAQSYANAKGGHRLFSVYLRMERPLDSTTPDGLARMHRLFGSLDDTELSDWADSAVDLLDSIDELRATTPAEKSYFIKRDAKGRVIGQRATEREGYILEKYTAEDHAAEIERDLAQLIVEYEALLSAVPSSDAPLSVWAALDEPDSGDRLRAAGFDGLVFHENDGKKTFAVLDSTQIKSAVSNNGDFDPANPDIRFSRAPVAPAPAAAATSGWDAPVQTGFDDVIYKLQDKNIDLKRVVESISKATGKVADSINAYLKEELFHKRAAKRVEDFGARELKPLMNQMRLAGLSMEDVEEYLHARHAKEANAVIAQRNPGNAGLQDGGSGMTNAAADNYFAKLDPTQRRKLEAVAKSVDAIIEGTRKLYVDYGLEDQAVVDGWANMYQHYIPLMREDKDGGMGTGQGFSVKGKETKGRTGSTRKVVDILANVAMQREKLIVRGEKNIVAQALVGLAQANPNPDFWEVRSEAPTERVFDQRTGVVVERPDPLFKSRENVVVTKVKDANGNVTEQMVVFNEDNPRAVRMAAAMKNLDAGNLEGLLGMSAKITRYFSAINTQYNPVFGVVNLVRDVQGAMVNLAATPLAGQQGKIAKDTVSALRGIYSDIRKTRRGGQATSQWAALWEQMQDDGGTTGYRELFTTSADRANNLKSILNPEAWMDNKWGKFFTANGQLKVPMSIAQKGATEIFGWLSDYNEAMENGVRLAAYKAALDKGMSREQAASLAKNLTVNFNRKGQVGMQAGAVYAFFNAAMQGTARIGQTLFDMDGGDISTLRLSKTGKAVVYGGVTLGVMQALALAGAGFDEEDPPEFVRERSLIIPTGGKTYVSIPMPLGLHVIPGIGRHATEFALSGFDKPAKRALSVIGMFADAFNPIGNAGLSMQTLAPTALDPLVALTENKDWTGKPIARVSSNKAMPGHTQWKDTATGFSKVAAEAINWISGGNEYVAGAFSPTPDQIDYLLAQVGGGVAREAAKVQQTISTAMSGETLPTHKIPLLGRFAGNAASQASQGTAFYANLDRLNALETEIKGLRKDGRFDEAAKLARENPESMMIAMANRAERDVQKLRREKRELIAKDASREEVRAKEERITDVMTRLNEAVERRKAQADR